MYFIYIYIYIHIYIYIYICICIRSHTIHPDCVAEITPAQNHAKV